MIIVGYLLFLIVYHICLWKLFGKMGISKWKSLFPIYNEYLLCKKVNISKKIMIGYLIVEGLRLVNRIIWFIYILLLYSSRFIAYTILWMLESYISFGILLMFFVILTILFISMRGYVFYKISISFRKKQMTSILWIVFGIITGLYIL